MTDLICDVAVIGAGTAGLAAERHARRNGARTLLIDPAFAGTTCATVGCMPSKLLIAAADSAHGVAGAAELGVPARGRVDGPAVMARLRRLRDDFAGGVRQSIADLPRGVCVTGRARFAGPGRLELDTGDSVRARAVVVATGSAPSLPAPFRSVADRVLQNADLFDLPDLPASVGVIGVGPIGLELAQALSRLGVEVAVYDAADRLAGLPDETGRALAALLRREVPIHLEVAPEVRAVDGGVAVDTGQGERVFERLLVATGRPPALDGLDLGRAGIALDDDGVPLFDPATMQCGTSPVFVAGDATATRPLLHEATDEGTIAGRNAACWPDVDRSARKVPMAVTFTRPSSAVIGAAPDDTMATGRADYGDQGRARVQDTPGGLLRVHARRSDGQLTGADLCIPGGEHIAHLLAWAIQSGMTVDQALSMPFYHPTLEEGLRTALQDLCRALDRPAHWSFDDAPPPGR